MSNFSPHNLIVVGNNIKEVSMGYKIEIIIPEICQNPQYPIFWCILICVKDNWSNLEFGWSESIEQAWDIAYNRYINFYQPCS